MSEPRTSRDVAIGETESFLVGALGPPEKRRRVLEVGAGDGALAARLATLGHDVVAMEVAHDRANAARKRGIPVVEADFMGPMEPPYPPPHGFDAVIFTRVLHHLDPLEEALRRADSRLVARGLVIGEEFAWERARAVWFAWQKSMREAAGARGLLRPQRDPIRETLESWQRHHGVQHRVHRGEELRRAVSERFEVLRTETAPYLYRYLCADLADVPGAVEFATEALAEEKSALETGRLAAVGLRFVARTRSRA